MLFSPMETYNVAALIPVLLNGLRRCSNYLGIKIYLKGRSYKGVMQRGGQ